MVCEHEYWQRESSVATEGYCPICQAAEIKQYKKALGIALTALKMYADPESYHAMMIIGDRPCGEFADDFSYEPHIYQRHMPGKRARIALKVLAKAFGDLPYEARV